MGRECVSGKEEGVSGEGVCKWEGGGVSGEGVCKWEGGGCEWGGSV